GDVFAYNYITRNRLKNSLTLSEDEVERLLAEKVPYVVRFKMPIDRILNLEDIIRGKSSVNTNTLDDKVLVKNDGMPTYHFANIIDDHEMEITHVIRGEEWLPSLGLHYLLYEAMGWERPQFAHLSLILKPEGKGKLSKRDGDKFGFPVFPLNFKDPETGVVSKGYREEGYLPEAFINMVALLGWSPANDREILSLEEMTKEFDLHKVHKAGARFSKEKAEWFNHEYLKLTSDQEALVLLKNVEGVDLSHFSDDQMLKIISLMKERATFIKDIYTDGKFFFEAPSSYDEKAVKKAWNEQTASLMDDFAEALHGTEIFEADNLRHIIHDFAETKGLGMGKVMMPLRLALVGELKGPDVPDILQVLGKEESVGRIKNAVNNIS
ncbi:MAG: glutamate--tRNA ligase, partial [Kaistella sp.]|nr:glutamate--tRNA ligase [Kaistella sp.]